MRTALPLVLLALALALVAAFVTPARAQYVPHTADWWAAAADQADYEAMAAPSQAPWVPVGSLDYEYDVQGLEDTLGAGGADLSNYGNPNFGSGSVNFGDAYGAGADWNANLNLPVTSGGFGSGGFGSGGFGAGGSTKSAMPTFQAAMPTTSMSTMTKAQRVYAPQVLQTVQEQLPETTASPKYLQPVIKTHVIDQPVIQPKIVRQPIIQQRIVEQPVLRTRIVNQPVIRRIVTQPVLRPRIIQQTQYQPQYIDQPVVQPRIIEQTIVREQLMEKQQQNQPIVSAPLTSSKKGGASYQQQF